MATSGGPDIVRNGLVFGMDNGYGIDTNNISSRFYPGEPTTNLINTPLSINNVTSTDIPQELAGKGITGYASYSSGYSVFPDKSTISTSSTGKTFRYSIWMRSPGGVSTYLLYVKDGTGPDGGWWSFGEGTLTDEWQRITGSRSNMTGTVTTIRVYRRNQQGTIEIVAPQLEVKSHVTPFLTGTRSSTESLIDLTKSTNIDVSNVSFDSDGQPTFDGTNDRITFSPGTGAGISQTFTVSAWVNCTNVAGSNNIVSKNGPYFMRIVSSKVRFNVLTSTGWLFRNGTTILSNNTWYNFHMVYDGSTWKGYINGEQEFSTNKTGTISSNATLYVGYTLAGGEQAGFSGKIPIVRIYNRALSAQEVQRNYNAYKNRFDI